MSILPQTIKKAGEAATGSIVFDVARRPESSELFFGSSDFQVYAVDFAAEKPEHKALEGSGHQSYVTGTALAGNHLVTGSYDGQLIWWDAEAKKQIRAAADAHSLWIRRVEVSPDGKLIASVADDMLCRLWDAATGEPLATFEGHAKQTPNNYPSMLYCAAFSPDGQFLATADKTGHIIVREVASGKVSAELDAPVMYTWDPKQRRHSIGGIRSLEFSPDGRLLAAGGIGKIGNIDHLGGPARLEVFDWQAGKRIHEIENDKHKGLIEQIAFDPQGKWLLTVGGDHKGFITFYDQTSGEVLHQMTASDHVHAAAVSEDFTRLYTAHHGRLIAWDLDPVPDYSQPVVAPRPPA